MLGDPGRKGLDSWGLSRLQRAPKARRHARGPGPTCLAGKPVTWEASAARRLGGDAQTPGSPPEPQTRPSLVGSQGPRTPRRAPLQIAALYRLGSCPLRPAPTAPAPPLRLTPPPAAPPRPLRFAPPPTAPLRPAPSSSPRPLPPHRHLPGPRGLGHPPSPRS